MADDLIFRTLIAADAEGEHAELLTGWGQALLRGFNEGRMDDDHRRTWLEGAAADGMRMVGAWPASVAVGDGALPVATYASWSGGPLNVGDGRSLPLHMITDVTVAPTHRRRGLLRRLMTDDLRAARESGLALAALTATEGTIYGRFGFGPATRSRAIEVDVTSRFALHPFEDDGSLELVEPAGAWEVLSAVFEAHRATTRGALAWPGFYEALMTGRFDYDTGGPDKKLRVVVHLDAAGSPDGFASYVHAGEQDGRRTLDVHAVVGLTPAAHKRLWRFLADVDLTERVRCRRVPVVDPLEWAVTDPRVVRTTRLSDMLWLRVLDVVGALQARPWYAEGSVVLDVVDDLGLAAGRWRVEAAGGRAQVSSTDDAADVRLSADVLGSLYLGGVDTPTLAAAGRLAGSPDALARWAALADGGPAPWCTTGF